MAGNQTKPEAIAVSKTVPKERHIKDVIVPRIQKALGNGDVGTALTEGLIHLDTALTATNDGLARVRTDAAAALNSADKAANAAQSATNRAENAVTSANHAVEVSSSAKNAAEAATQAAANIGVKMGEVETSMAAAQTEVKTRVGNIEQTVAVLLTHGHTRTNNSIAAIEQTVGVLQSAVDAYGAKVDSLGAVVLAQREDACTTATEALDLVKALQLEFGKFTAAVKDAFTAVDQKLTLLAQAAGATQEEKEFICESSFPSDAEPAGTGSKSEDSR